MANRHPAKLADLYRKKFVIREDERIATAGSCFAQHIASRLRSHGYNVLDAEPTPYAFDRESAHKFGFGLYSARYGNIYTVRQLLQLVLECQGLREPAEIVWTRGGRCFDALRPTVEPDGLASAELVRLHRDQHLGRVRQLFYETTLLVFTLGLTETWEHRGDGTVYPTAPGTVAGDFSPETYAFKNLAYHEIVADFLELRARLREASPGIRFLLTVSPVPLTATASGDHVLLATTYSKAVLRAAAGALASAHDDIDYFPSYEIIAGAQARGFYYEGNLRDVAASGVDLVMETFFAEHGRRTDTLGSVTTSPRPAGASSESKLYCEELLLEAFAP